MSSFGLTSRDGDYYQRAHAPNSSYPGADRYNPSTTRFGTGNSIARTGITSDSSFRDFSASFGPSAQSNGGRSDVARGGPIGMRTLNDVSPTQYTLRTDFDRIVDTGSFAATLRRKEESGIGLHAKYTRRDWIVNETSPQRTPRIPGVSDTQVFGVSKMSNKFGNSGGSAGFRTPPPSAPKVARRRLHLHLRLSS